MRTQRFLAVLLLALAMGGPMAPTAAQAAPSGPPAVPTSAAARTCPPTFACFWVDVNFGGARGMVRYDNPDYRRLRSRSCPTRTWNDCISSIANSGTRCTVYFFRDVNYQGGGHSLARGDRVGNFGAPPPAGYGDPAFNDTISSNRWCHWR